MRIGQNVSVVPAEIEAVEARHVTEDDEDPVLVIVTANAVVGAEIVIAEEAEVVVGTEEDLGMLW